MVYDFKETLEVTLNEKCRIAPMYSFAWTKEDLATGEVETLDFGEEVTLGEVCKLIDDFGGSNIIIKARIEHFLMHDRIVIEDEY